MTQNDREELIFDIASDQLKRTSQAGIWGFALSYLSQMLESKTNDELLAMLPPKKKKNKQPKGF